MERLRGADVATSIHSAEVPWSKAHYNVSRIYAGLNQGVQLFGPFFFISHFFCCRRTPPDPDTQCYSSRRAESSGNLINLQAFFDHWLII